MERRRGGSLTQGAIITDWELGVLGLEGVIEKTRGVGWTVGTGWVIGREEEEKGKVGISVSGYRWGGMEGGCGSGRRKGLGM